jgi:dUTP pyrophosphatase
MLPAPGVVDLPVRPLSPRAMLPAYQSALAAGLDIAACLDEGVELVVEPIVKGGVSVLVPTGLALAVPPGFEAQIRPRSGLATRLGLTLPNAPGTIDADYRGELKVPLINLGQQAATITHGMRIAQMIIAPVARAGVRVVAELDPTARGHAGFGSTGVG